MLSRNSYKFPCLPTSICPAAIFQHTSEGNSFLTRKILKLHFQGVLATPAATHCNWILVSIGSHCSVQVTNTQVSCHSPLWDWLQIGLVCVLWHLVRKYKLLTQKNNLYLMAWHLKSKCQKCNSVLSKHH